MRFRLENSDHHPEAVHHPLDRACPGEIHKGEMVLLSFLLKLFHRWPLPEEEKKEGSLPITARRAWVPGL